VTNITFIFETSPNTKPKEKKLGGTWHIMSPPSEKVGYTSPISPTKLHPCNYVMYLWLRLIFWIFEWLNCNKS